MRLTALQDHRKEEEDYLHGTVISAATFLLIKKQNKKKSVFIHTIQLEEAGSGLQT